MRAAKAGDHAAERGNRAAPNRIRPTANPIRESASVANTYFAAPFLVSVFFTPLFFARAIAW